MGVAFGVDPPKQQVFALWSYFDFFRLLIFLALLTSGSFEWETKVFLGLS